MNPTETQPEAPAPVEAAAPARRKSLVREYAEAIFIAVMLALVIRQCGVQAFTIPSGSMMDTLLVGDYILVNKFLYGAELPFTDTHLPGFRKPERGDIVVFKYPADESRDFIKRIIAVGDDTVQVQDNRVNLNGQPIEEPYIRSGSLPAVPSGHCGYLYGCEPLVVPQGAYFVMGDNRDNSQDSRFWGFVRRDKIAGRALFIYWSWDAARHGPRLDRVGQSLTPSPR